MASSSNSTSASTSTLVCANEVLIDDIYFSALFDYDELFPISDETYAHELHIQEALLSSTVANFQGTSQILIEKEDNNTGKRQNIETETSEALPILCMICMEPKPYTDVFVNKTCTCEHSYCSDCIGKHIAAKIQESISRINCPSLNCRGVLAPELCQEIIPKQVFYRWEDALCESLILAWQKLYCPFKDCSAVLIDDGEVTVTQAECPNCRRLFCARCMVAWHSGMDCSEFQRLGKDERSHDDLMAMELAKRTSGGGVLIANSMLKNAMAVCTSYAGVDLNFAMAVELNGYQLINVQKNDSGGSNNIDVYGVEHNGDRVIKDT